MSDFGYATYCVRIIHVRRKIHYIETLDISDKCFRWLPMEGQAGSLSSYNAV